MTTDLSKSASPSEPRCIERFDLVRGCVCNEDDCLAEMEKSSDGDYVRYSDVAPFLQAAEPQRDEPELQHFIDRWTNPEDLLGKAGMTVLIKLLLKERAARSSAAPLNQTPTSLIAGARLRHTEKISELNNLNENLLRALREIEKLSRAYACNQVGLDILKIAESALASLPQPSAGQWVSVKDRLPTTRKTYLTYEPETKRLWLHNLGTYINGGPTNDKHFGFPEKIEYWADLPVAPSAGQTEGK